MRYIIVSPAYTRRSAGITVLHELQKWLIRFGKDAMMMHFNDPYAINDDDIVVYPEIISGNPLKAKRVVRYVLNEPGKLGGDKEYDSNERVYAYDRSLSIYSGGEVLTVPILEDFFCNRHYERTIDCVWVGKGINTEHPVTRNCVEITYSWPTKRRDLADILNKTNILFSYDDKTHLLTEAVNCGCDVKLIINNELVDYDHLPVNLDWFKCCLSKFIHDTCYPEIKPIPDVALHLRERGIKLKLDQRYEEAIAVFVSARNKGDIAANTHIGDCHAQLGNLILAEGDYITALHYDITDCQANIGLGVLKLLAGETTQAENAFNKVLKIDHANSKALCGLGMTRLAEGRIAVGIGHLKQSLNTDPENLTAISELVKCAYQSNRYADALEYVQRYLMHHPSDSNMLFTLAGLLYKSGKLTEAYDRLECLLVLYPDYVGGNDLLEKISNELHHSQDKIAVAKLQILQGQKLMAEGNYVNALEIFLKLYKSGNLSVSIDLGDCLTRMGRMDEAITYYDAALQQDIANIKALMGLGVLCLMKNWPDEAITWFRKILGIDPTNAQAFSGVGMAQKQQHDLDGAFASFTMALHHEPENLTALNELLGIAYETDRLSEAEPLLKGYLRYHPTDNHILYSLAGLLYRTGKFTEAHDTLENILIFEPEYEGGKELRQLIIDARTG